MQKVVWWSIPLRVRYQHHFWSELKPTLEKVTMTKTLGLSAVA
jgi:hypothetical protein